MKKSLIILIILSILFIVVLFTYSIYLKRKKQEDEIKVKKYIKETALQSMLKDENGNKIGIQCIKAPCN